MGCFHLAKKMFQTNSTGSGSASFSLLGKFLFLLLGLFFKEESNAPIPENILCSTCPIIFGNIIISYPVRDVLVAVV